MAAERPVGREADFEQFDVLLSDILEQLTGNALHHRRGRDALPRDAKGFQNGPQVLELVIDLYPRVESGHIIGGQFQAVFAGNVDNRRCAHCPFEVTVNLGFGETVVLRVKTFHACTGPPMKDGARSKSNRKVRGWQTQFGTGTTPAWVTAEQHCLPTRRGRTGVGCSARRGQQS